MRQKNLTLKDIVTEYTQHVTVKDKYYQEKNIDNLKIFSWVGVR